MPNSAIPPPVIKLAGLNSRISQTSTAETHPTKQISEKIKHEDRQVQERMGNPMAARVVAAVDTQKLTLTKSTSVDPKRSQRQAVLVASTERVETSSLDHATLPTEPFDRSVATFDVVAELLGDSRPADTIPVLKAEAKQLLQLSQQEGLPPEKTRALNLLSQNMEVRAQVYEASAPGNVRAEAKNLEKIGKATFRFAEQLEKAGLQKEAKLLRAVGADSQLQGGAFKALGLEADKQVGLDLSKYYRGLVNAVFDERIGKSSGLSNSIRGVFNDGVGPRDQLELDKKKMNQVFDTIDRLIQKEGLRFDQAWVKMFDRPGSRLVTDKDGNRVWFSPKDDAMFLRDHEEVKDLLAPMSDISEGLSLGDAELVDHGRAELIQALRDRDQFDIAHDVLQSLRKEASTEMGKKLSSELQENEGLERFWAGVKEFGREDLPMLIATLPIGAGVGSRVFQLGRSLGLGARSAQVAGFSSQVLTDYAFDKTIDSVILNRGFDKTTVPQDLALHVGAAGLFNAFGRGWKALRRNNLDPGDASRRAFDPITINTKGVRLPDDGGTLSLPVKKFGNSGLNKRDLAALNRPQLHPERVSSLQRDGFERSPRLDVYSHEVIEDAATRLRSGTLDSRQLFDDMCQKRQIFAYGPDVKASELSVFSDTGRFGVLRQRMARTPIEGRLAERYGERAKELLSRNSELHHLFTAKIDGESVELTSLVKDWEGNLQWFHTPHENIPKVMKRVEALADNLLKTDLSLDQEIEKLAEIHWLFAHAMPTERGSALIGDWYIRALARSKDIDLGPWRKQVGPDLEVLTSTKIDLIKRYKNLFNRPPDRKKLPRH